MGAVAAMQRNDAAPAAQGAQPARLRVDQVSLRYRTPEGGTFAALDVKGPSSSQYAGADWKFVNTDTLQMQASLHYIRERSKLTSLGIPLSDERFDVAELAWAMNRTDQKLHGIDLLQVSVRKSIADRSVGADLVSPNHASSFLSTRLSYTRLQFLTKSQRAYFKLGGQWTNDALAPLEQFVIGGPDSVRAYPIADGLADRGYYASLEYHVDAPGFGDKVSPFYARPWRELLELEAFIDYARGFPAGADRTMVRESVSGIVIPRANIDTSGANFEILIGFDVTPEMAAFNRDGKRFRVNAGKPAGAAGGQ